MKDGLLVQHLWRDVLVRELGGVQVRVELPVHQLPEEGLRANREEPITARPFAPVLNEEGHGSYTFGPKNTPFVIYPRF